MCRPATGAPSRRHRVRLEVGYVLSKENGRAVAYVEPPSSAGSAQPPRHEFEVGGDLPSSAVNSRAADLHSGAIHAREDAKPLGVTSARSRDGVRAVQAVGQPSFIRSPSVKRVLIPGVPLVIAEEERSPAVLVGGSPPAQLNPASSVLNGPSDRASRDGNCPGERDGGGLGVSGAHGGPESPTESGGTAASTPNAQAASERRSLDVDVEGASPRSHPDERRVAGSLEQEPVGAETRQAHCVVEAAGRIRPKQSHCGTTGLAQDAKFERTSSFGVHRSQRPPLHQCGRMRTVIAWTRDPQLRWRSPWRGVTGSRNQGHDKRRQSDHRSHDCMLPKPCRFLVPVQS
jgi:hypothetical protein